MGSGGSVHWQLSRLSHGSLEEKLVVVELGGEQGPQQLEGDNGCEPPDGVGRTKVHRHAVASLTLKYILSLSLLDVTADKPSVIARRANKSHYIEWSSGSNSAGCG
jgi:hypothetical protein